MILNNGIKKFQELLVFLLNFFRQENVSFWFIFDITQALFQRLIRFLLIKKVLLIILTILIIILTLAAPILDKVKKLT